MAFPENRQVRMYATRNCPYCHRAEALLGRKGIRPHILLVDHNPSLRLEMARLSGGKRTVPQIFIGNQHVGGYDDLSALDRSGILDRMLGIADSGKGA